MHRVSCCLVFLLVCRMLKVWYATTSCLFCASLPLSPPTFVCLCAISSHYSLRSLLVTLYALPIKHEEFLNLCDFPFWCFFCSFFLGPSFHQNGRRSEFFDVLCFLILMWTNISLCYCPNYFLLLKPFLVI